MLPALLLPVITKVAGIDFSSGSPRYEGGPLISSVQQRLQQIKSGNAAAIAQTHADAVSGGAGWKDVALVLAPAVAPLIFGSPSRPLTAQENQIIGLAPGNPAAPAPSTTTTLGQSLANAFGFGPANQQAAAAAAGTAAGSQLSSGIVKVAVILGVVVIGVVLLRRFLK